MYGLIRFIIAALILFAAVIIIKKLKPKKDRELTACAVIFSILVATVTSFFPFENAFITFSSPESAYRYTEITKSDMIIEGKTTDLVVGSRNNAERLTILQKTEAGWKLGRKSRIKMVSNNTNNGISVTIYRYKTSDDFFVMIFGENGKPLQVNDTLDSEIFSITRASSVFDDGLTTYYLTVHKPDLKYRITVNGNDFFISES